MSFDAIFNIKNENDFESLCLETFNYQYKNTLVYKEFVDLLGVEPGSVTKIEAIPFLPIQFFKTQRILAQNQVSDFYFQSSGTTAITSFSKHYIADKTLYEKSIFRCFETYIGKPTDFVFLGLLPNYLEKQHSSLVYMVDYLMKESQQPENGYFLNNHQELFNQIITLANQKKKCILFGVSFALLDFIDFLHENALVFPNYPELIIIETGGMKGRKTEITKDQLLQNLTKAYKNSPIYSEYSMTELLSQAYSITGNRYQCPHWMRILIRKTDNPFSYCDKGRLGAINIIDLANRFSCSFIATQDLGKCFQDNSFEVLGRIDHSDMRGCSMLVS